MNANRRPDRSAVARGILTVEVVPHISSRYLVVFLLSLSVQCLPRTLLHCTYGSYPVGSVLRVQSGLKRSPFCLQSRNLSHLRPSFAGRPGSFARLRSLRIGENRSGGGGSFRRECFFYRGVILGNLLHYDLHRLELYLLFFDIPEHIFRPKNRSPHFRSC